MRVLAGARADDGTWVLGTRDALVLVPGSGAPVVRPWETVESASWVRDEAALLVREVGGYGEVRPEHTFAMEDPGVLLELVRERVTASVVLQRHTPVAGRAGFTVIARRAPRGDGDPRWMFAFDPGVDPADPEVRAAARTALVAACAEVGADPAAAAARI